MLLSFLNRPYPYFKNVKSDLLSYACIGLFVAGFLIIFQPFEINAWVTPNKTLKLSGFGVISFLVPVIIAFLFPLVLPLNKAEESWTVYKEILMILAVLIGIAIGNIYYGRMLHIMPAGPRAYLLAFMFTFLVGIFPVSAHVMLKHNRFLKRNLQQSLLLNEQIRQHQTQREENLPTTDLKEQTLLSFIAENEKDVFNIRAEQLLFIASADNYSTFVYIEDHKPKKLLFRSSLKKIESQLPGNNIVRCHRSYIVNLANIKSIEGNAAGYKLFFNEPDEQVPVSRNYIPLISERLKSI